MQRRRPAAICCVAAPPRVFNALRRKCHGLGPLRSSQLTLGLPQLLFQLIILLLRSIRSSELALSLLELALELVILICQLIDTLRRPLLRVFKICETLVHFRFRSGCCFNFSFSTSTSVW